MGHEKKGADMNWWLNARKTGRIPFPQTIRVLLILVASATLVLTDGCNQNPYDQIGSTMDEMARKESEYGTMGMSSPVLAAPNSDFAFNLSPNTDQFFKDAQNSR